MDIINKSIVIYGSRGSGKSVICKDIMYRLKNEIPCAIVFNGSEASNSCFSTLVSKPFLYDRIELKVLEDVWKRQESITEIYKKVNNVVDIAII
jgi:Cdc6-like AAA superfamily ATPase